MTTRTVKVIPALDTTSLETASRIAMATGQMDSVYGYKVGFALGLTHGLPRVVNQLRVFTDKPIIYDHQKAATDIPDTGKLFGTTLADAGVTEAILFPQSGPAVLKAWVAALSEHGLKTIVGGVMTHPAYLQSEGGFLLDDGVVRMYRLALEAGVRSFVVPLTKPAVTRSIFDETGMTAQHEFYSPGFGKQGGNPADFSFIRTHYLIIGRSLLQADDPVAYIRNIEQEIGIK